MSGTSSGRFRARRAFLADMMRLTAALPLLDLSSGFLQPRVPRIGFMSGAEPSLISSFEDELAKLGYSPGENIEIEMRLARRNTNDTATHAAELGAMPLDFVVVAALPAGARDEAGQSENADGDHHLSWAGE